VFLALASGFGLAFALITPPLQAPDEERHLVRAYGISEGHLLPIQEEGRAVVIVPREVAQLWVRIGGNEIAFRPEVKQDLGLLREAFREHPVGEEREAVRFPSYYSPLVYLPGALAIAAMRAVEAAPIAYVTPGRLLYLLAYCAIIFHALRRAPAHRWTLAAIALLPMSVFQAAAISADGLTVAFAFAAFVELTRLQGGEAPLTWRALLPFALWSALLGLTKPVYLPLAGLALLLPARRFPSRREHLLSLGCVAASALPLAAWMLALSPYDVASLRDGADPGAQVEHLLKQPQDFLAAVVRSLWHGAWKIWLDTFVGVLGYLDTRLPGAFYTAVPVGLCVIAALDGGPTSPISGVLRIFYAAIGIALTGLVMLSAYIGWNAIGHPVVWGVQGRYFLPIAPLMLCALHLSNPPVWAGRLGALWTSLLGATLAISLHTVFARYYVS